MCKRPFYRNGNLTTCIYKVSAYAFIMKYKQLMLYKYIDVFKGKHNKA